MQIVRSEIDFQRSDAQQGQRIDRLELLLKRADDKLSLLTNERDRLRASLTGQLSYIEKLEAELAAARKELEAMREIAGNSLALQGVRDQLGPLYLWTKSGFDAEVKRRIDAAIGREVEK